MEELDIDWLSAMLNRWFADNFDSLALRGDFAAYNHVYEARKRLEATLRKNFEIPDRPYSSDDA